MSQHSSPSTGGNYWGASPSLFIPPYILARAEKLASKAAELKGLIAPQPARCLAKLFEAADAPLTQVWGSTEQRGSAPQDTLADSAIDPRRRIVALLSLYDQSLISEPIGYGAAWTNIRHSFALLGLNPHLWRLPRAISRWNQMHAGEVELLEYKLTTCIEEVDHILDAFNRKNLRERVLQSFSNSKLLMDAGVSATTGPAVLNLLILGSQPSSEFRTFTGLRIIEAEKELTRLKGLGLVEASSRRDGWVEPGLPPWFAEEIGAI
ncbi:hypothetical protein [Pseudomonas sp. CC120222-01a]|uniref:hypothetical protein n=1 Tax=Pseudomonas sp. CC120222-01a TaxID=1378075 RepID=UPI000D8514FA|nr:hypothetical protein [Pseudomonas sp. CC120222-01a]PVZ42571.1 hypothetical protein N430_01184 [Pseudomonas sp. CC120222-01a]